MQEKPQLQPRVCPDRFFFENVHGLGRTIIFSEVS